MSRRGDRPEQPHATFFSGKDDMQEITIIYNGRAVVASKEVAEFLEQERKRENAESRSDRRHKDFIDLEAAEQLNQSTDFDNPVLNVVLKKEAVDQVKSMISALDYDSKRLIELHYYEGFSLTAIAEYFGISKQAISKRHTKLLQTLRELMET